MKACIVIHSKNVILHRQLYPMVIHRQLYPNVTAVDEEVLQKASCFSAPGNSQNVAAVRTTL
jgi:hypothetical protein